MKSMGFEETDGLRMMLEEEFDRSHRRLEGHSNSKSDELDEQHYKLLSQEEIEQLADKWKNADFQNERLQEHDKLQNWENQVEETFGRGGEKADYDDLYSDEEIADFGKPMEIPKMYEIIEYRKAIQVELAESFGKIVHPVGRLTRIKMMKRIAEEDEKRRQEIEKQNEYFKYQQEKERRLKIKYRLDKANAEMDEIFSKLSPEMQAKFREKMAREQMIARSARHEL